MTATFFFDMAAAVAVIALLAESYGAIRRRLVGNHLAPLVLGVLFGAMAAVQMHAPISPFEGVIIDLRNVPIALAGAFLGWRGLLSCLAIAMTTRFMIGGVGMEAGLWGMAIAGLAGMIWARKMSDYDRRNFAMLLLLALAMSTHLLAAVIMPHDAAVWVLTVAAGPILLMNLITVPLIGGLLERENRRILREERLAHGAARDRANGLLSGHAFVREVTNAFAAKPLGAMAGILVISPQGPMLRDLLWRDSAASKDPSVDARLFSDILTHWNLAGRSADGRILIPISDQELDTMNRIKPLVRAALRQGQFDGRTPLYWDIHDVDTPHPPQFLEMIERAVQPGTHVWMRKSQTPPFLSQFFGKTQTVQRGRVFDPVEHDALFAKASFLIERGRN